MKRVDDQRPWLTPDFELKFRQAFGRDMTAEERAFFGMNGTAANPAEALPRADEDENSR
ncbi:MAG: hypothetical protein ACJ71Q_08090 [Terriglobales bacterium]|jgi:hypothetical protein